jgi:hypothetical protein
MDEGESPSCYTDKRRVARKEHKCCECNALIKKGETYRYFSGIWDGEAMDFKTCMACEAKKDAFCKDTGYYPPFGMLEECIGIEEWEQEDT